MFKSVWRWAGKYRSSERNIGVAPHQINMQLRQLFDDVAAWRALGTFDLDQQAYRLHHRLTVIHPFPNGNGRVARLIADHYLVANGSRPFSWGETTSADLVRSAYLKGIRQADAGNYAPLAAFVRS